MRSWLWKGMLGALVALPALSGAARAQDISGQTGDVHITKNCSQYTGAAGSFCTITSSNVPEIPVGAKIYYDQAFGVPADPVVGPMLDSNAVLLVGKEDWAVGRCTLDGTFPNLNGLCNFADGVGPLTGFSARVVVSHISGLNYAFNGSYHFSPPAGQQ